MNWLTEDSVSETVNVTNRGDCVLDLTYRGTVLKGGILGTHVVNILGRNLRGGAGGRPWGMRFNMTRCYCRQKKLILWQTFSSNAFFSTARCNQVPLSSRKSKLLKMIDIVCAV